MLFAPDSPLRQLPNFPAQQLLVLDGIRYGMEMSDLAYSRLVSRLQLISESREPTPEDFVATYFDAWSMVSVTERVRNLTAKLPGLRQKDPEVQSFMKKTAAVKDVRNFIEHSEGDITEIVQSNLPYWGTLNWVWTIDDHHYRLYSLRCGVVREQEIVPAINPLGKTASTPIGMVTLSVSKYQSELSILHAAVVRFARVLEQNVANTSAAPDTMSDVLVSVDLTTNDDG